MRNLMAVCVLSLATLGACASGPRPVEGALTGELDGAPKWVETGDCLSFYEEPRAVLCGMGSVGGTRNIAVARSGAQGRARTEIARTLEVKVKAMLKDYQNTVTGGEYFGTQADDEQTITDVSKQVAEQTLVGSRQVAQWVSPKSTIWTMVEIDPDTFKTLLSRVSGLDPKLRQAIMERADKAFEELRQAR